MKTCSKCNQEKSLDCFHKQKIGKNGYRANCIQCEIDYSRLPNNVASIMYSSQLLASKQRGHDAPSYTREEFKEWALAHPEFKRLYELWKSSGYLVELKPSFDRLNEHIGYSFENLQCITYKENKNLHYARTKSGETTKRCFAVDQFDMHGNFIQRFHSINAAVRAVNGRNADLWKVLTKYVCKQKRPDGSIYEYTIKSHRGFKWEFSSIPNKE